MPFNETYGLDRMELVANHSSAILEIFGLLGHLFVNGTLGYVKEFCVSCVLSSFGIRLSKALAAGCRLKLTHFFSYRAQPPVDLLLPDAL